jgi:hypothetical protein
MRKVSMHAERDWTPLRDGIVSAGRHIQSSLSAVSCMSPSDLLRFAQHEAKVLMSGEPLRQLVAQMNADSAEIPAEDEFVLGEQVAPITSHTTRSIHLRLPSLLHPLPSCARPGEGGRLKLPDASSPSTYRGSAAHTYLGDKEQVARIAGKQASGVVSKVAASANGKAIRACVPRDAGRELILVAASHEAAGAWLLPGYEPSSTHVYLREDMDLYADIVYDKLEEGAHIHCCSNKDFLEPKVRALMEREAAFRGEGNGEAKLMAWKRNGQWHTECMCARAAEMEANSKGP